MSGFISDSISNAYLRLRDLAVGYNGRALIHGIEIGVRPGEIVTLVGPNGSGKSTILKTITGQLRRIDGEILLRTKPDRQVRDLGKIPPADLAKQMAVVLTGRQQTELLTCRDVVSMGRYPYTGRLGILTAHDEEKVTEALGAVHAEALGESPFDAVSDGERQRILLARAICQEPEIIVLDEPTSFLDIRHKLELLSILYEMARKEKITVVMSLHELDLAMKISDRVLCVKGEEIFACGAPSEVLTDEAVRELYDLDPALGRFDTRTGSLVPAFAGERGEAAGVERDGNRGEASGTQSQPGIPRFMIAASGSGSGKTLLTCGLLRLLMRRGLRPAAFKCGPDYIDPMFHRQVIGVPSRNLDTFFSPDGQTMAILEETVRRQAADIAVIEGVMGYYDGTGADGMQASSCDLAAQTGTPAILVVDAKGLGRSVVPLVKGLTEYCKPDMAKYRGRGGQIRAVILNRVSSMMAAKMKAWIEEDTGLRVVGYLPQDASLSLGSRHLGLLLPEEIKDLQEKTDHLADMLEETVNLEALLEIAGWTAAGTEQSAVVETEAASVRIGVALDEAFGFYYEDNLELLKECGAELVFFSPLRDSVFPDVDGLLLGGGYPELHARELTANKAMREQIRSRANEGMPILAECGGFMYLQEVMLLPADEESGADSTSAAGSAPQEGNGTEGREINRSLLCRYEMCGVLPGTCRKTDHLVRFGYLEMSGVSGSGYLTPGHSIRGHEFHYFDSTENGACCTAVKPGTGKSWECMVVQGNVMAGFPHLYYRSDPDFVKRFIARCREVRGRAGFSGRDSQ